MHVCVLCAQCFSLAGMAHKAHAACSFTRRLCSCSSLVLCTCTSVCVCIDNYIISPCVLALQDQAVRHRTRQRLQRQQAPIQDELQSSSSTSASPNPSSTSTTSVPPLSSYSTSPPTSYNGAQYTQPPPPPSSSSTTTTTTPSTTSLDYNIPRLAAEYTHYVSFPVLQHSRLTWDRSHIFTNITVMSDEDPDDDGN